jgi:hypothetical protein
MEADMTNGEGVQPNSGPIDLALAEALIAAAEREMGRPEYCWYVVDKSRDEFAFSTVSSMHSQASVDRKTGKVSFSDWSR